MTPPRDLSLDIAKGIAIALVILGHTFQGMRADFDSFLPFRIVYAFHMPLFIFLSGAVTVIKPHPALAEGIACFPRFQILMRAIGRSALRLMVPFVCWTMVGWYVSRRDTYSLLDWLLTAFQSVDNSLWFLPLVFDCLVFWGVWNFLVGALRESRRGGDSRFARLFDNKFVVIGLFWLLTKMVVLPLFNGAMGLNFVRQYLGYFALGMLFRTYGRGRWQGAARIIPYVAFVFLVPFWHRTEPLVLPYIGNRADGIFRLATAAAGILVVLDIVDVIQKSKIWILNSFLAYCGTASLGIYAMHYYLLGYPPAFLAPLLGSLLGYEIMVRIPLLNVVLLGEKRPAKFATAISPAATDSRLG